MDVDTQLIDISLLRVSITLNSTTGHEWFFDLGALVYTDRKEALQPVKLGGKRFGRGLYDVNVDSYKISRTEPLELILEHMFILSKQGQSGKTLIAKIVSLMRYISWCDDNNHQLCLDDYEHAKNGFRAYINSLEHECKIYDPIKKQGISRGTASRYQNNLKKLLMIGMNITDNSLFDGIRLIKNYLLDRNPTEAPSHKVISQNLELWHCLFHGISDFLLGEKQYPFQLSLPNETVWVFPSYWPFETSLTKNTQAQRPFVNFEKGILKEVSGYGYKLRLERIALKTIENRLSEANIDLHHIDRKKLGRVAHDAFAMLFMLHTRTRTEIRNIQWEDNCSIEKSDIVGFRLIKARAKGKVCEYKVGTSFTKEFKRFLKLREWQLNGQVNEFLFIGKVDKKNTKKPLYASFVNEFYKHVVHKLIDPNFPKITPSEMRVSASNHFIKNHDTAIASIMLQNSESTVKAYYSTGNPEEAAEQITSFFSKLSGRIITSQEINLHTPIPSGHCFQLDNPVKEKNAPIPVSCITPQGCLFCDNFVVHSDEADIRKLLSLEFIIKETKNLAHSIEQYEAIYGGLLKRINSLLIELAKESKSLVVRIRKEVYEEEKLSEYWDKKLSQLVRMDVL